MEHTTEFGESYREHKMKVEELQKSKDGKAKVLNEMLATALKNGRSPRCLANGMNAEQRKTFTVTYGGYEVTHIEPKKIRVSSPHLLVKSPVGFTIDQLCIASSCFFQRIHRQECCTKIEVTMRNDMMDITDKTTYAGNEYVTHLMLVNLLENEDMKVDYIVTNRKTF